MSLLKYQPFPITAMKKMLEGDASQRNQAINKSFCNSKATTMTSLTYFEGTINETSILYHPYTTNNTSNLVN